MMRCCVSACAHIRVWCVQCAHECAREHMCDCTRHGCFPQEEGPLPRGLGHTEPAEGPGSPQPEEEQCRVHRRC